MLKFFLAGLLDATRHWKMVLLLLAANLLLTIPIVLPLFLAIVMTTSRTAMADAMLADKLDPAWIADLLNDRLAGASIESLGATTGALLLAMGLASLTVNALFAGGILETLAAENEPFTMRRFWAGCGAWFGPFARLLALSLLASGIGLFLFGMLSAYVNRGEESASAYTPFAWRKWALTALLVAAFAAINLIFDYAKIGAVLHDRRGMLGETLRATRFAAQHPLGVIALYAVTGLTGWAVFALPVWLRGMISQSSAGAVLSAFLLGQIAIGARMWARVMMWSAELRYFRRHHPEAAAPPPEFEFARAGTPYEFVPAVTVSAQEET